MTLKLQAPLAVVVPRLRVGGADAYVRDALASIQSQPGSCDILLYVIHPNRVRETNFRQLTVVDVNPALSVNERIAFICMDLVKRGVRVVLTQLLALNVLRTLWKSNVRTIIVFQNQAPTWSYSPAALDPQHVPFVITSCKAMADSLAAVNPRIEIRIIQPMPDEISTLPDRNSLRMSWNIPGHAFVIGMVGTFKLHKRYTHAVRILHNLRARHINAFLVIAGGHAEKYGGGEQAHHAVLGLARTLLVQDHLRCLGELATPGDIYKGSDVFLNTSLYEGLSRATVTAASSGCPVVASDVGGQREVLSTRDRLVAADSSAKEFAEAIISCAGAERSDAYPCTSAIYPGMHAHAARQKWEHTWLALHDLSCVDADRAASVALEAEDRSRPRYTSQYAFG